MKRAFIIHGWDGYPEEGWFPWLKTELEKRGFVVTVPNMPHPETPTIEDWVNHLKELVGEPDNETYLIGHSIGCQAVMRYLASLENKQVGGIVLVAGFIILGYLPTEEERKIAKPWLETPIDYLAVKKTAPKISVVLSDNDNWVPLEENKKLFEEHLSAKITIEKEKGHFSGSDGVKELPPVLNSVLSFNLT